MRWFHVSLILLLFIGLMTPASVWAEAEKELFSTQGIITAVDPEEGLLHVKVEGALELTFRADEATEIEAEDGVSSLAGLALDDSIEIKYFYNKNYEKVARSIRRKTSAERI